MRYVCVYVVCVSCVRYRVLVVLCAVTVVTTDDQRHQHIRTRGEGGLFGGITGGARGPCEDDDLCEVVGR